MLALIECMTPSAAAFALIQVYVRRMWLLSPQHVPLRPVTQLPASVIVPRQFRLWHDMSTCATALREMPFSCMRCLAVVAWQWL